jgi:hypothetical protein
MKKISENKELLNKMYELLDNKGCTYKIDSSNKREYTCTKQQLEEVNEELKQCCTKAFADRLIDIKYDSVNWCECELSSIGTYRAHIRVFIND